MRPVCVPCQCAMRCEKNGFCVMLMTPEPYQIFHGDKWRCPECGHETVTGFPPRPIAEHHDDDWQDSLKSYSPLEVHYS